MGCVIAGASDLMVEQYVYFTTGTDYQSDNAAAFTGTPSRRRADTINLPK